MARGNAALAELEAIGLMPQATKAAAKEFTPESDQEDAGIGLAGQVVYDRFSPRVAEALGFYVYRLVDPRNDETFYVGRGVGNRVFDHFEEAYDARMGGKRSAKTDRINEIHDTGQQVRAVIHRHSLRDDHETGMLEAALIEAYPNLTNQVAGEGTTKLGARSVDKAIAQYDMPPAPVHKEKCLILSLSRRWPIEDDDAPFAWRDIYQLARYGWRLDVKRAQKAEFVVAYARGVIRAVFTANEWLDCRDPVFAGYPQPTKSPAYGFVGSPAPWFVESEWVGRRIPDKLRARFGRRVRYVNI
ncbi:MAG: hypothetical protein MRY74_04420 [Neomegalonema sp.]|nr:hypothetical protein [Neomegalonema sp.]